MDWLRLWHDMPNDPKWRTIARVSGQPISLVQAMYVHLLVDASRNVTRGHVTVTKEDIASALDVTDEQVEAVFSAMQDRVLDGDKLTGWEGRQPKREDAGNPETGAKSAAERKRAQRKRQRNAREGVAENDMSQGVTVSHDRLDTDKSKDIHTHTAQTKFSLHDAWEPDPKTFTAVLYRNGMAGQTFEADQLLEFRSYWISRPDDLKTQAQWEHALAQQLKRQARTQQANGGTPNETGRRIAPGRTRNAHDILTDPNW
ncbi:DnaT-like ssDNA-binding domain-containing protein [Pseudomonas corrugata]|uniref:DnaT-like ssDNA-binding domain-containing protein n=1 Tax=Pseudomonas corrugata TaxID=47879 RepID=UPI00222FA908|nr:DnaT-like ssDNA-binding domain-containing protein [Pseudomonas corrugata]UZD96251.1 DnaT-like ssDNA-binding domain-containing protein [Pseudomonas corrugata]